MIPDTEMLYYTLSEHAGFELALTRAEILSVPRQGQADEAIAELVRSPAIRQQLDALAPALVRDELKGYGAWEPEQLADHEANLHRLVWLAVGYLQDGL